MGSNQFFVTLCVLAGTVGALFFGAVSRLPEGHVTHGPKAIRRVEVRGISVEATKPAQATVNVRITDGNGHPVDCQTTLDIAPVFDESLVARMKTTTCPPRSAS